MFVAVNISGCKIFCILNSYTVGCTKFFSRQKFLKLQYKGFQNMAPMISSLLLCDQRGLCNQLANLHLQTKECIAYIQRAYMYTCMWEGGNTTIDFVITNRKMKILHLKILIKWDQACHTFPLFSRQARIGMTQVHLRASYTCKHDIRCSIHAYA